MLERILKENKIILLFGIFLMTPIFLYAQAYKYDSISLGEKYVILTIPELYKKKVLNYDEGIFVDLLFKDGSIITLFKGTNQKLPLLNKTNGYNPDKKVILFKKEGVSLQGVSDNICWREDSVYDIRILYDRVPIMKKNVYDSILDSIVIKKF